MLFPMDPNECFHFAAEALDLAERLQTPVFLMTDLDIGMNQRLTEPFKWDDTVTVQVDGDGRVSVMTGGRVIVSKHTYPTANLYAYLHADWEPARLTYLPVRGGHAGLLTKPRDTINVVAAAGGCGTFIRIISAPVVPRDSAAARILVQPSSVTMAGPACCNPVTHSATYPQTMPMA